MMKKIYILMFGFLLTACAAVPARDSASTNDSYQAFNKEITFNCAKMQLKLSSFTVDMNDVPVSAGKANMFYSVLVDVGTYLVSINGSEPVAENFVGELWVNISFGNGNQQRTLPQEPKYFKQVGHKAGGVTISYKGGVQHFDTVLNPEQKQFDIYYDLKCKNNEGMQDTMKFKTKGSVYKWPGNRG